MLNQSQFPSEQNEVTVGGEVDFWEDETGSQYHFPDIYRNMVAEAPSREEGVPLSLKETVLPRTNYPTSSSCSPVSWSLFSYRCGSSTARCS